jgi:crotonobetainyl-CoA:carnitine CoA-transferase CaiB-like acyl-CoA transferase
MKGLLHKMSDLLKGVKVFGFIRAAAGSACAKILAEFGAETYLIEPMKGHPHRHLQFSYYEMYHGNMKSVPINPRNPKGLEFMHRMLEQADIFVSNYRPQVLQKIGLDYETLSAKYSRLIYATVSGYGEKGPMSDAPGFDITAFWARSGLLNDSMERGSMPINAPAALGDIECGKSLATGVIAALYDREKTGKGTKVSTSLYFEGLYANHCNIIDQQYGIEYPRSRKDNLRALKNSFHCKDGWVQAMTLDFEKDFKNFLSVIHRDDLIGDPRWKSMKDTEGDKALELTEILDEAFAKLTVQEVIEGFASYDMAASTYYPGIFTVTDPQAIENNYFEDVVDKNGHPLRVPRVPIQFGEEPVYKPSRFSKLGGDTRAVMKQYGYSDEEIEEFIKNGVVVAA